LSDADPTSRGPWIGAGRQRLSTRAAMMPRTVSAAPPPTCLVVGQCNQQVLLSANDPTA
jgi:hypothetical protein